MFSACGHVAHHGLHARAVLRCTPRFISTGRPPRSFCDGEGGRAEGHDWRVCAVGSEAGAVVAGLEGALPGEVGASTGAIAIVPPGIAVAVA
eukprot:7124903-Lingulodinium_polyedra.AAC.1